MDRIFLLMGILFWLPGCAHVISAETLRDVDRQLTFGELRRDPNAHTGKNVLLGGVIVETSNRKEGTLLEIYHTRLDSQGMPVDLDQSGGRFLALYEGFLDSEIYRRGRRITLAGVVRGKEKRRLGQIDYVYPTLMAKEIFLWEERVFHEPYPWGYGDPWWDYPWYPWPRPYRWRYPHRLH
jgi:outer membrane lipoprotein